MGKNPAEKLPINREAEKALLGSLILDSSGVFGLDLEPADFGDTRNRNIYQAIIALLTNNETPSYVSILQYYKDHFEQRNGTAAYISNLTDDFVSIDIPRDAALIQEIARQRQLRMFLGRTLDEKWDNAGKISVKIQAEILKQQIQEKKSSIIQKVAFRLSEQININKIAGEIGCSTGWGFLDRAIGGFVRTHLWIIGAYTSIGKTAFMTQLVVNALQQKPNIKIAIFSTEMSSEGVLLRLIANRAKIPTMAILGGNSIPEIQHRIDEAFNYFHTKNIWLFDDIYAFEKVFLQCKQLKITQNLDLVFVDFLQNMEGRGTIYDRMSVLPVRLQKMAKDLDICLTAMSQISNEAARADSKIITFKGAGEIAAACDLGLWLDRDKKDPEILFCSIRKNRHGATGKNIFRFTNNFTSIE